MSLEQRADPNSRLGVWLAEALHFCSQQPFRPRGREEEPSMVRREHELDLGVTSQQAWQAPVADLVELSKAC